MRIFRGRNLLALVALAFVFLMAQLVLGYQAGKTLAGIESSVVGGEGN